MADLPAPVSLGSAWSRLSQPQSTSKTSLPVGDGCGAAHSGIGSEVEGIYDSKNAATLEVELISVPNAAGDYQKFKQAYLSGCLKAIRVGRTAWSGFRPVPQLLSSSGVGVQAKTHFFGIDSYEILYCTWHSSVLAVMYYRGSQPDWEVMKAATKGFASSP
jgi:hypothetical protein